MTVREPRNVQQATELLEQYAVLDGQIAEIEANRQDSIAAINARADTAANDLIGRRDAIAEKLQPWWAKAAAELTEGKRKSIELGGCMIGSRAGLESLVVPRNTKATIATLLRRKWAKPLLRAKVSIDKVAVRKAMAGPRRKLLAGIGFSLQPGEEQFFVERAEQGGTLGGQ